MYTTRTNVPLELAFRLPLWASDPVQDMAIGIDVVGPDGESSHVPAFWAGGDQFKVRFAAPSIGRYRYELVGAGEDVLGATPRQGEIEALPYEGNNELYRHGRLRRDVGKRHLRHADGKPFLWLGDTQWQMFTSRLDWPHGFDRLERDRAAKGFSVVQVVAGPLPDFDFNEAWHHHQSNDAGWPWHKDWSGINPDFYDLVDLKISGLVDLGLMPCVVGMWGFWLPIMGLERAKEHWRYLVARYGAFPVVWCLAGEVQMPVYANQRAGGDVLHDDLAAQAQGWTEMAHFVRSIDPQANLITAHPAAMGHMATVKPTELPPGVKVVSGSARTTLLDDTALDFDMLQPGHYGFQLLDPMVDVVNAALAQDPVMPVVNAEVNYEGIAGSCWEDQQRFQFWTSMTDGAAGYTYGAAGIWQFWTKEEFSKGGDSDNVENAGGGPWEEVMHLPGSTQVGIGRRFFEGFPWWRFERIQEPEAQLRGRHSSFATGIPGALNIYYLPSGLEPESSKGMLKGGEMINFWWRIVLPIALADGDYQAYWFDPRTAEETPIGVVQPTDGYWTPPAKPSLLDWVLVVVAPARLEAVS